MDLFTTLEKPRRGTRLPEDWSPSPEARQFAIAIRPSWLHRLWNGWQGETTKKAARKGRLSLVAPS